VFLCVSRTAFRMSLAMVVRRMLCSASLTLHSSLRMIVGSKHVGAF